MQAFIRWIKLTAICAVLAALVGVTLFDVASEPITSVRAQLNLLGLGQLTVIYRIG